MLDKARKWLSQQARTASRALLAALVIGSALLASVGTPATDAHRVKGLPSVVLWAWERREDLSFIDPRQIAVAYLARTLVLSGGRVILRPRFEPLTVPERTMLIPAARLEIDRLSPPLLSPAQRSEAARIIAAMAVAVPPEIQVDFDATVTQRAFYRDLLADVHDRLPPSTILSMTALASWCMGDDWLGELPVDEIVPMLYRMGRDGPDITSYLRGGRNFVSARARQSVGLSTDEPVSGLAAGKRLYLFSARRWTPIGLKRAILEASK